MTHDETSGKVFLFGHNFSEDSNSGVIIKSNTRVTDSRVTVTKRSDVCKINSAIHSRKLSDDDKIYRIQSQDNKVYWKRVTSRHSIVCLAKNRQDDDDDVAVVGIDLMMMMRRRMNRERGWIPGIA